MNAVATWLIGATVLFAAALVLDALLARRRPLAASALWNAVLVAALAIGPAVWLLPRVELAVLPVEKPLASEIAAAITPAHVNGAEQVTAGRLRKDPQAMQLPSGAFVPVPHRDAFAPVVSPSRPGLWRDWDIDLTALVAVSYMLGVAIMFIRLIANLLAVRELRRDARPLEAKAWLAQCGHWRRRVAQWRAVALLESSRVSVPIVLGWWRPAIVIPDSLADETDTNTIDAILVHELTHVERADCGWQLIERVVQVVYWFHPLVWLASRRLAAVRERACDDFAIHALADRDAYAEKLLDMATRLAKRQRLGLAMAVVRTTKLERRLAAIERSDGAGRVRLGGCARATITIALLLFALGGGAVRLVHAEAEPNPSAERKEPNAAASKRVASAQTRQPIQADGFQFHEALAANFSQAQRDAAREFYALTLQQKLNEAMELFSPQLREALPEARFRALFAALEAQFGNLQSTAVLSSSRIGDAELLDLMTIWGRRNNLSIRLLLDMQNRIDGIWLGQNPQAADDDQQAIKFEEGGGDVALIAGALAIGDAMRELARTAHLSLTVNLVDRDGQRTAFDKQPPPVLVSFFRAVRDNETAQEHDWHDTTSDIRWRRINNESRRENHAERLAPGRYRAFFSRHQTAGYQLSDPIVLDGVQRETTVDVPLQPGATAIISLVDEESGDPVTGADVRITSHDPRLPSYRYGSSEFRESRITFDGMLAGRHQIEAHRQASEAGERGDYEQVDSPQFVELEAGKTTEAIVKMRAKPVDSQARVKRWPFVVTGRVVDGAGQPVEGAEVKAWCGIGTLRQTGNTHSDADGNYTLRFGPGLWSSDGIIGQVAVVSASKDGYFEKSLGVQGQLMIAEKLPPESERRGAIYVLPQQPHAVNFVLMPAARIAADFIDAAGRSLTEFELAIAGKRLPPASSVLAHGKTNDQGEFLMDRMPVGYSFWWSHAPRGQSDSRSLPFALAQAGEYRMRIQLSHEAETGRSQLRILQVLDPTGRDVTGEVVQDDPLLRDPLVGDRAAECREIVQRMLAANRLWLRPAAEVRSLEFELQFDSVPEGWQSPLTVTLDGPDATHPPARHGITYASALAALEDQENVVFRALDKSPERTVLAYSLKKPVRVAAGNGVERYWRGQITSRSREGVLVIDTARNVPLKLSGDALIERFDEYREVKAGQFVPQRVRIERTDATNLAFDWSFEMYEPAIWMFSASRNVRDLDAPPVVMLENLRINGEAAKRLAALRGQKRDYPAPHGE